MSYGYDDVAQCKYKVLSINDIMSTNDLFQEQSCENKKWRIQV